MDDGQEHPTSERLNSRRDSLNLAWTPLEDLAKIAQDPTTEPGLRAKVLSDLLPYMYPRRKAVELAAEGSGELVVRWADAK